MAFIKAASPTYFAPAVHNTLDGDGVLQENKFDMQFKRHSKTELQELDDWIKTKRAKKEVTRDRDVVERVATGWRAVEEEPGKPLPYSMAAVDDLEEKFPGFVRAVVEAFYLSTQPKESAHLAGKN